MIRCLGLMIAMMAGMHGSAADTVPLTSPLWTPSLPETVCCTKGYSRVVHLTLDVPLARHLTIHALSDQALPEKVLTVSIEAVDATHLAIRIKAIADGHGVLELRDATQAVIRRCRFQVVAMTTSTTRWIGTDGELPDGSVVFTGDLVMNPYVPGLDVRFVCLGHNVIIPDGLTERWIATETFTPTPSTGGAHTSFRMVRGPKEKWVPYCYIIYQDGEQIDAP